MVWMYLKTNLPFPGSGHQILESGFVEHCPAIHHVAAAMARSVTLGVPGIRTRLGVNRVGARC